MSTAPGVLHSTVQSMGLGDRSGPVAFMYHGYHEAKRKHENTT